MAMNNFVEQTSSGATETALALEARLDAALADTFPASDPVAITVGEPPHNRTGGTGIPPGYPPPEISDERAGNANRPRDARQPSRRRATARRMAATGTAA